MSKSSSYCPAIYKGLFVDRINDDKIHIAPCCQSGRKVVSVDDFDFHTNDHLQNLRQQVKQGLRPSDCEDCWKKEAIGEDSRRLAEIRHHGCHDDYDVELNNFDYSPTWACNSACISCSPSNSSMWAQELNLDRTKLLEIGRQYQKKNFFVERLDLSQIKNLHFNGGEPLLNRDGLEFINRVSAVKSLHDVRLTYNTNATVFPDDALVDQWAKMKMVRLFFSIDAVGTAFEYIRWPGKWAQVSSNMLKMRECLPTNVLFGFNITVGCYNIYEIDQVFDWINQHLSTNRAGGASDITWQPAHGFYTNLLNDAAKQAVRNKYQHDTRFDTIISYMDQPVMPAKFVWTKRLDAIDERRGTSWRQSLKISQFY